jgi:hypothetical protein
MRVAQAGDKVVIKALDGPLAPFTHESYEIFKKLKDHDSVLVITDTIDCPRWGKGSCRITHKCRRFKRVNFRGVPSPNELPGFTATGWCFHTTRFAYTKRKEKLTSKLESVIV